MTIKAQPRKKRQPEAEFKDISLESARIEVKAKGDGPGEVSGYASVFGVIDLHGDIIAPGAFRKTIAERVPAGKIKLLNSHIASAEHTIGTIVDAREDEVGLFFRAELSSTALAQEIRTKMNEGHLGAASIGFDIIDAVWEERDGEMIRVIREVKLYEISVVPFPANEMAGIRAKSALVPVPYQDLPLAPEETAWNENEALERVKAWAGGDAAKMRRAHLALIPGKGYDMLIADIVDGELAAVPDAIKSYLDKTEVLRVNAMKYLDDTEVIQKEIGEESSPSGPPSSTRGEEAERTDTQQAGPPQAPTSERSTDHLKSDSRRRRSLEARLNAARQSMASHGVPDHASCRSAD